MSNKDKKARTFDLMSMLESTTQSAIENSRETLSKREAEEEVTRRRLEADMNISLPAQTSTVDGPDDAAHDDGDDDVGPALPPGFTAPAEPSTSKSAGDSGLDDDDGDEYEDFEEVSVEKLVPTSSEVTFAHGKRAITAMAVDSQGARLMTGCLNFDVKLWDFAGMDAGFKSFRQLRPYDAHILKSLAFSLNGEKVLVASGHTQAKLLERNGKEWAECIKGDNYLHDARKTKGHTAALNGGTFHPWSREEFMTYSDDATIRLWSLQDFKVITKLINTQRSVIVTKTSSGMKVPVTAATYSKDGKLIAGGCMDGSIQIWKHGGLYVNHAFVNRAAHVKGNEITSVSFSYDNKCLLSRSMDDTMKLWDLRNFKAPVHVAENLENLMGMTECGWSPRDELCMTGTSCRRGKGGKGSLVFLDKLTFKPAYQIDYPDESVIRCLWHPKINQVFAGLSGGTVKLYYDAERSARGALLCVRKPAKRERRQEIIKEEIILAPLGEKLFEARNDDEDEKEVTPWRVKKFLRMKQRDPNRKYPKAEEPFDGHGAQGKLTASGSTLHSYFAQQLGVLRNKELLDTHDDVRSSILRHAADAEKESLYIGKIYDKTQPVKIFAETTADPNEVESKDAPLEPHFKKPRL